METTEYFNKIQTIRIQNIFGVTIVYVREIVHLREIRLKSVFVSYIPAGHFLRWPNTLLAIP